MICWRDTPGQGRRILNLVSDSTPRVYFIPGTLRGSGEEGVRSSRSYRSSQKDLALVLAYRIVDTQCDMEVDSRLG